MWHQYPLICMCHDKHFAELTMIHVPVFLIITAKAHRHFGKTLCSVSRLHEKIWPGRSSVSNEIPGESSLKDKHRSFPQSRTSAVPISGCQFEVRDYQLGIDGALYSLLATYFVARCLYLLKLRMHASSFSGSFLPSTPLIFFSSL